MADYKLSYSGEEIDEAVALARAGVQTVDLTRYNMPYLGVDYGVQTVVLTDSIAESLKKIFARGVVIFAADVELAYDNLAGNRSNVYDTLASFATNIVGVDGHYFGVCTLPNGLMFKVELIGRELSAILTSSSGDTGGSVG